MPHQNRVTPYGEIVALPGRGTMLGNRGVVHDERAQIVRPWQVKRWIACALEFRGRYREVMTPRRWTHLFFLDEATAFSAGHRPCAECRHADYRRFRGLWEALYGRISSIDELDAVLHRERVDGKKKRTYRAQLETLPDGAFVALDGAAWLVRGQFLHRWSDQGYVEARGRENREVDVLTPRSIVGIFTAGYIPQSVQ